MSRDSSPPWEFVKTLDRALLDLEKKPHFTLPIDFPWEKLSQKFKELFSISSCTLSHRAHGWKKKEEIESYFSNTSPLEIFVSSIEYPLYWILDEFTKKKLCMALLDGEEEAAFFLESSYLEGFYTFFIHTILSEIEKIGFNGRIALKSGKEISDFILNVREDEAYFVLDINCAFEEKIFEGQLLISPSFREKWNLIFHQEMNDMIPAFKEELAQKIALEVAFEVGKTRLSLKEWQSIRCGDWLLLDDCFYDPQDSQGRLLLTLNGTPIFRGKIKENGIKIYDYPKYQEVSPPMADKKNMDDEDDDDLYGDFDEDDDDLDEDFDDDEDLDDEDLDDEDLDDEDLDEEDEDEEEDDEEEDDEDALENFGEESHENVMEENENGVARDRKVLGSQATVSSAEIPIEIIVEVGRVRMSAKELLQMMPGNLLELDIVPERGVDLMVGGQKVGRGELVKLGELLGVRIVEL